MQNALHSSKFKVWWIFIYLFIFSGGFTYYAEKQDTHNEWVSELVKSLDEKVYKVLMGKRSLSWWA